MIRGKGGAEASSQCGFTFGPLGLPVSHPLSICERLSSITMQRMNKTQFVPSESLRRLATFVVTLFAVSSKNQNDYVKVY